MLPPVETLSIAAICSSFCSLSLFPLHVLHKDEEDMDASLTGQLFN